MRAPPQPPSSQNSEPAAGSCDEQQQPHTGLVIVNYSKHALVEHHDGALIRCVTRRNLPRVVCGDHVRWRRNADGSGVIESIEPRRTLLQRTTAARTTSPLAANLDQLVIVTAIEPAIDTFLIDKYTVAAELARLEPLIVTNKSDLLDDPGRQAIDTVFATYRAIGYQCVLTSALRASGMNTLRERLRGRSSILVGQSGVGKSSLIQQLLPDLDIAIGKLSVASGQGKHTTTATTLYHLPDGGDLIDSPGVRDFHTDSFEPAQLAQGFREFHDYYGQCRFSDCLHNGEPDCAVEQALQQGLIQRRRMDSYRRLLGGR